MIVRLILDVGRGVIELLQSEAVEESWDQPSALEGYTVGALAGHLSRGLLTVDKYLSSGPPTVPDPVLISAARYFATVLADHDPVNSEFHRAVRSRADEAAAEGPRDLAETVRGVTEQLERRLDAETLSTPIEVLDGVTLTVAEYLKTRLVELVIHMDDLAVSVGVSAPSLPADACVVVAGILGELAAMRSGCMDTIRSLARAERHPGPVRAL